MGVFGFVLPSEVSPGVGVVLEKFWNSVRQNLCEPCTGWLTHDPEHR